MNGSFIAACKDGQLTSCLSLLCTGLNLAATKTPEGSWPLQACMLYIKKADVVMRGLTA